MTLLNKISKELNRKNVFHKISGNYIITRRTKIKIPNINNDIAYFTGVIAGDGSLITSKRKKGGYYYDLKIYSGSLNHLSYLNALIKKLFKYSGKITKDERKNKTYVLAIRAASIFYYFKLLDAKYTSNNLPPFTGLNQNHLINYLCGLIDTDGSISGKRIQLKLKNSLFIENIYKTLLSLGIKSNTPKINYTNSKPFYYIRFDNVFPLRLK